MGGLGSKLCLLTAWLPGEINAGVDSGYRSNDVGPVIARDLSDFCLTAAKSSATEIFAWFGEW